MEMGEVGCAITLYSTSFLSILPSPLFLLPPNSFQYP